jgi:quercetin dioxygenase-like cupin family protein
MHDGDQTPTVTAAQMPAWGTAPVQLPGERATLRQIFIPAGTQADRHSHPHEQFLLVISGNATLHCEQGPIPLLPGTALRVPAGAWHSALFRQDTVLVEFNLT